MVNPSTLFPNPPQSQLLPVIPPYLQHPGLTTEPDPDVEMSPVVAAANKYQYEQRHHSFHYVDMPNNLPMPGEYNFSLHFEEERKEIPKSTLLTYSDILKDCLSGIITRYR